jgi:hypothetical protein
VHDRSPDKETYKLSHKYLISMQNTWLPDNTYLKVKYVVTDYRNDEIWSGLAF